MSNLEDYTKSINEEMSKIIYGFVNQWYAKPRYIKIKREDVEGEMNFHLLERLGKKIKHPMHKWYTGNLMKRIFVKRFFRYELSLYKEVNNDGK